MLSAALYLLMQTGVSGEQQAPFHPGLAGDHGLSEVEAGAVWVRELGCAACHATDDPFLADRSRAPDLARVTERVRPGFLSAFLTSPRSAEADTTMPDLIGPDEERTVEALVAFLGSLRPERASSSPPLEGDARRGEDLHASVGCAACHLPQEGRGGGGAGMRSAGLKYSRASLAEFLYLPSRVRPSGRMPDLGLSPQEAADLAAWLVRDDSGEADGELLRGEAPPTDLVDAGRAHFERLGCAACHTVEGVPAPAPARPLADLRAARGCLAPEPQGVPDFHLSEEQRRAISVALEARAPSATPGDRLRRELTSFSCLNCHQRGDVGGSPQAVRERFTTSEPELGEEAVRPPSLTGVGAKLRTDALHRVLFDGEGVRPYLSVRMPRFEESLLRDLPELLAEVDGTLTGVALPAKLDHEEEKVSREGGRALVGQKGLNCIACHDFAGLPSPGFRGIDLLSAPERLRPEWFLSYLRAPRSFRPGTVMPDYWPDGVAVHTEILGGDTTAQLHGLWRYLTLGRSARLPEGMRNEPTTLRVEDSPRLYRGRSGIAGFRGVAVGFDGISFAFDAEHGALAGLWRGGFVRVHWSGQSPGSFDPDGRAIRLARDLALLADFESDGPWPLRPRTSEEQPVNPDPTYAARHGYRFGGYAFDEGGVPTLFYRVGEVEVEDRSVPAKVGETTGLERRLVLKTEVETTLHLPALVGAIEDEGDGRFRSDDLRLHVAGAPHLLRPAAEEGQRELLLRLDLAPGDNPFFLRYELHP